MSERHSQLANLLFDLEKELRESQLWAEQSPAPRSATQHRTLFN